MNSVERGSLLGTEAGVAHFAHLGGMLGAYLVLRYWRGSEANDEDLYR